ncbi:hypothetical protein [Nonomuraea sp. LPB2021202275-12-8]|uniref:hypothetical protein n=1 Tax=Nonomuraea sp. LPB2021202275-12-8 TaxID=3120159 RepID=UPI00300C8D63
MTLLIRAMTAAGSLDYQGWHWSYGARYWARPVRAESTAIGRGVSVITSSAAA